MRLCWGTTGDYWYPLQGDAPPDALAFVADAFETHIPASVLQRVLSDQGIQHVFELREYGPEYELELALVVPSYNGAEGYWAAGEFEWLIYASHESTITVAGSGLVHAIQQEWPNWAEHLIAW